MNIVHALLDFLKKKRRPDEKNVPEGLCPNCWGKQEYGGKFFEVAKNYNVDINSKDPSVGWVKEYADKYLLGIELKQQNGKLLCQKCKRTYRPV